MGNSTFALSKIFDVVAARGIFDPRTGPSGFGDLLALDCANQVMADLICERYNHKWNSQVAEPFYTNSWQQDYPQLAQPDGKIIGWGEDLSAVNINNTQLPKPVMMPTPKWRRALPVTSVSGPGIWNMCWMYNKDMQISTWPGAGVVFYPLVGVNAPAGQNPLLNMRDAHGNILIVTTFGTTGSVAPVLPVGSAEGLTVTDGSVVWTCVSPDSQGFRISLLPSATGIVWKVIPVYQLDPPVFSGAEAMQETIDPIPDSYMRYFRIGLEAACLEASPNPGDMQRGRDMKIAWLNGLLASNKQGDRETNIYSLQPQGDVLAHRDQGTVITADNPYGTN